MKRLFSLILSTIIITQANGQPETQLHGKIQNRLSDSIYFEYNTHYLLYKPIKFGIPLNPNGEFVAKFLFDDKYMQVDITHGNQATEVILAKGSNVTLRLDAANFDSSISYTSKNSEIPNFVAQHVLHKGLITTYNRHANMLFTYDKLTFQNKLDSLLNDELDFVNNTKINLPSDFRQYWTNRFVYFNHYCKIIYPGVYKQIKKQMGVTNYDSSQLEFEIPNNVYNDVLIEVPEYRLFLSNTMGKKFMSQGNKIDEQVVKGIINETSRNLPQKTAELGIAGMIYQTRKFYTTETLTKLFNQYNTLYPGSAYTNTLKEAVVVRTKTSKGQPAMDFTVKTIEGKTVKLSELKGKVVYLDFWASWCMPCIAEMPHSKKIFEQFADNEKVILLTVSTDINTDNWKKAVDKYNLPGIHGLDGGGWQGKIAQLYNIESVPTYFLIDKNGNFALDSTPRPSDEKQLIDAIKQLID